MKIQKNKSMIGFAIVAFTLHMLTPFTVFAGEVAVTASNIRTQGNSTNDAQARIDMRVSVINENNTNVSNGFVQDANTGNNIIAGINGNVGAVTGDISQEAAAIVTANHNSTEIGDSLNGVVTADNETTQSDSTNVAESVLNINVDVVNKNNAAIENSLDSFANTGINSILDVNGDARLKTGNIEYKDDFNSIDINKNNTYVGYDSNNIVVRTKNNKTQSDSINTALAHVDIGYKEHNEQDLDIENHIVRTNNTGGNECVEINGDCELTTGTIKGSTSVDNTGNNNNNGIGVPMPDDGGQDQDGDNNDKDPAGNGDIDEGARDEKTIIEKIIEKIIPSASAQEANEQQTVLGAAELPETGVGSTPYVGWLDVLFGIGIFAAGLLIKRRFDIAKSEQ